jgi:enhancing lycopene biosynthesis protein 2
MKKIGVVLSGCGVRDGSEIHEAVLSLLAIDKAGCEAICMAQLKSVPDCETAKSVTFCGVGTRPWQHP